jgi:hypothetical protein
VLPWPVWKFQNVVELPGGAVRGELFFDRATPSPAEWNPVYDGLLWPRSALLRLFCNYTGEPLPELLEIQLVP